MAINEDNYYKTYVDYRAVLVDRMYKARDVLDKALLSLSAGAFGLSITFVHYITPQPKDIFFLGYAWILFVFCMLCTLISLNFSENSFEKEIELSDKDQDIKLNSVPPIKKEENCWTCLINIFNLLSIASFMLGVSLLGWFCWINVEKQFDSQMPDIKIKQIKTSGANYNSAPNIKDKVNMSTSTSNSETTKKQQPEKIEKLNEGAKPVPPPKPSAPKPKEDSSRKP